jgi:5-methylthioadenosine/S-adenosylhomocysteine deaminase
MKTVIRNGIIIPMDSALPETLRGDIAIDGRKIVSVGDVPAGFRADRSIDARNSIVVPGLINAHSHLAMVLLRNYADDMDLFTWLNEKIWPIEEKMTESHVFNASLLGAAELIRSGVTSYADMYFFQNETCRAVEQAGIRARIGAVFFGDKKDVEEKLPFLQKLYDEWNGRDGRIHIDAAPHSAYTLSSEALKMSVEFAVKNNTRIHIHVSESKRETEENYEKHGVSPVEYLDQLGIFSRPVYAAHCVQLNDKDLDILKKHGVSPVHNPSSNLKLGNGFAPVSVMLEAGMHPALGTDGASSNNNLNMFEEIHLAAIIHKGAGGNPEAVTAYQALQMATIYGAEALGIDDVCGSLTPGKDADIILVDTDNTHLQPLNNPVAALSYSAQASDVHFVMCAGEVLMADGELKTVDEKEVLRKGAEDAAALMGEGISL